MGAGASVPDEVTFEQAKSLAGDKWEDKLTTFWPEVDGVAADKITKEELLAIIQNIPSFATKHSLEERLNWDEQVVKGADNNAAIDMDAPLPPDATAGGPAQKREKVETEKREKLDMEEKRQAALAEANGMTKEELAKMKSSSSKSKGPAKPPRQARKPGKQQSSELRALLRQQKKASKMSGRPPSRGMDEMEIQILAKPRGQGPQAAPEVMTLGDDPAEPEPVNPQEQPGMVNCTC
eukprot:CAMPEP_0119540924 /NCGR_PEP_ID=MMETSP1344-20130328/52645_1 /TAXON_ID=236787 /ORGANISM="Florenciella parvula, Strain CCMP2471" /LENGTH=236 /DNA_ID=CAMNT_0007584807 /DNA_START=60 /DNA_END=770 /DNA_ORIENTATION=+